ncbi:CDP-diacylglycerol--glycerol-3-phosphate 3-phosphatidyltransferase [Fimbriiglobus ruber]|uniref:CDP-diacylglycerol--glycerol-3-phosphate 3-phosphatidyltransferase n=1 Tax=Fimbriiglobus ruber TaxID=1908690 RepID=A0A225DQC2_9BACT|nr:CDP-diacylglycerol--glycerol-3-phosphate 3-phosphatidyltransferase [Fimbriiglobus ruber]OWK43491.1 CDP-diacylglycerol--glycerol-3-phosphate 3-phosphatidyltransferase [Fimbriiglobus ruber]
MSSSVATSQLYLWNVPNLLSLSRLPLAIVLFACIAHSWWAVGLAVFVVAMFTDWLDGWWARRFNQLTLVGRNLDPLTDKVLIGGAFIFLIPVETAGVAPWMVTVVVCRELLITGLRGIVEAAGAKFGADWFGKLKTVLQSAVITGVFLLQTLRELPDAAELVRFLTPVQTLLLYAMLVATVGSGLQYAVKAVRLFSR